MNNRYERKTSETDILLEWTDQGEIEIETNCPFLDHMLKSMFFHAGMNVIIKGQGDTEIDHHHLVEDMGILTGRALRGNYSKRPNRRFGHSIMPMDDALVVVAIDISGRSGLFWDIDFPSQKCGDLDLEVLEEFWAALTREAKYTLHFKMLAGKNSHHIAEASFKGAGIALAQALGSSEMILSTKGYLD